MSPVVCSQVTWLFILSTGRSGSTTILGMLNQIPTISLSGENRPVYETLHQLKEETINITIDHPNSYSWLNHPNRTRVRNQLCSWILNLAPNRTAHIHGFKEIHIGPLLPLLMDDFPEAKFIFNFRENITAQLNSAFFGRHPLKAAKKTIMEKNVEITRAMKILPTARVFSLPLEDFDVEHFNSLLDWLNIRDYRFTCVIHHITGGYTSSHRDCVKRAHAR